MIYEKIFAVQQSLVAPKDQFNSFGKYKYRSCEGILEALKPLLKQNKMMVLLSDEVKEIGHRVYVEATATAIDIETGEKVQATASAREEDAKKGMDASQVTGASSSYARKYALSGLFAIDDNKDSDVTNTSTKEPLKTDDFKLSFAPDGNLYCEDCNSVIGGVTLKSGAYTAKDVAVRSLKKHGKQYCYQCQKNHEKQTS